MDEGIGIAETLRNFRDALRNPIPDVDSFVSHLSSTLQALHLHPTSVPPENSSGEALKAIHRFLPLIQNLLITSAIPTFQTSLDESQQLLLDIFFIPIRTPSLNTLLLCRNISVVSYQTITSLLSNSTPKAASLPVLSRHYVLKILQKLVVEYGLDELYWAVWSPSAHVIEKEGETNDGARTLRWEESVKFALGVPAKTANVVGRWKAEGWNADTPEELIPTYI